MEAELHQEHKANKGPGGFLRRLLHIRSRSSSSKRPDNGIKPVLTISKSADAAYDQEDKDKPVVLASGRRRRARTNSCLPEEVESLWRDWHDNVVNYSRTSQVREMELRGREERLMA